MLRPGDLAFFEPDARTGDRIDRMGLYLDWGTDGNMIFLSSREEANGLTIGDDGGTPRLNGDGGYHTSALRGAKRL
ncbi:hypothetical protein ACFYT4_30835 [Streptomyces sp. NPDC004609]|uniref:hypothetical protein n=1 Tax=Streptomyces sp. NPDC004609 TaxID=3364704 RepID=UPI0036A7D256